MEKCYIDNKKCGGARFSFCDDCKKAKLENSKEINNAKTPVEMTIAHIPKGARPIPCGLDFCNRLPVATRFSSADSVGASKLKL